MCYVAYLVEKRHVELFRGRHPKITAYNDCLLTVIGLPHDVIASKGKFIKTTLKTIIKTKSKETSSCYKQTFAKKTCTPNNNNNRSGKRHIVLLDPPRGHARLQQLHGSNHRVPHVKAEKRERINGGEGKGGTSRLVLAVQLLCSRKQLQMANQPLRLFSATV